MLNVQFHVDARHNREERLSATFHDEFKMHMQTSWQATAKIHSIVTELQ